MGFHRCSKCAMSFDMLEQLRTHERFSHASATGNDQPNRWWGWVVAAAIAVGVAAMAAGGTDHDPPSYTREPVSPSYASVGLDIVWDDMTYSEQRAVCAGVDVYGVDWAAGHIVDGADGSLDRADARAFLRRKC